MNDDEEIALGTDPLEQDSDNDGLTDGAEVLSELDPLNPDSDDDGLMDGTEFTGDTDPLDADSDDDGIPDAVEDYLAENFGISGINKQSDTDNDGLPDYLELINGYLPNNTHSPVENGDADDDTDWVVNGVEWYLEEQLGFLGPKRLSEIESAQDRVIQIVRELEEDEEIILDTGGSDVVVQ